MVVKTRNPVNRMKLQQNTVVTTANGLPVDSVVDLQGTNRLVYDTTTSLSYTQPVVTVDSSVDLSIVKNFQPRYTGTLILIDALNQVYYIDRASLDVGAGTFDVYFDPELIEEAPSIDTKKGWVIAEGKLVNKMSVSSAAHIDEVHFNGFDLNLELDGKAGDSVSVVDPVTGTPVKVEDDGSTNVNCEVDAADGDSIMVVGTEDGTPTGTQHTIKTEPDGTISRTDLDRSIDNVAIGDETTIAKVDPQNKSFSMNRYEKILPLLTNAKWLELINFEEVTTFFSGDIATISYLEGGSVVAKAIFTFVDDYNWGFKLESYINDDNGDELLDDDGSFLLLD